MSDGCGVEDWCVFRRSERNASHLSVFMHRLRLRLLAAMYCFSISPFVHSFGELPIRRPNRAPPAATKEGPRTNDEIPNPQSKLIDQNGTNQVTVGTVVACKMDLED